MVMGAIAMFWMYGSTLGLIKVSAANHGFNNGDLVNILGVTGTIEANGNNKAISVIDANTYTINGSAFYHTYTGGGKSFK